MSKYLPFGRELVMTKEQMAQQENKFEAYDFYGIPYGIIDDTRDGEQFATKKDIDREKARLLIMQQKPLPKDLEQRLLRYKAEDEKASSASWQCQRDLD